VTNWTASSFASYHFRATVLATAHLIQAQDNHQSTTLLPSRATLLLRPMNEGVNPNGPGLRQRKEGFADVARWIALDSDSETSIYRKFHELAARNLLYLQAELLVLEKQLNELDEQDVKTDDLDLKDAARTWETLTRRHAAGLEDAKYRMELIKKLRTKLREYRV